MTDPDFVACFNALTGQEPFPWQSALYRQFTAGEISATVVVPTGLGKTSVIAVWLLARLQGPDSVPRRLVYVVNRRTVVDQTTAEIVKYREAVKALQEDHPLRVMITQLGISTLRGQFADNHEWSGDPSRPAVVSGTVDMIGSRLLFEGYRIGFRSRPLHAGFLGQDALLVHDEAHLEPAFQKLIERIQEEQKKERERSGKLPWPALCVMALSATARGGAENGKAENRTPFGLTDKENKPPDVIPDPPTEPIHHVWRRLTAKKSLCLHAIDDEKKLADKVTELTLEHKASNAAVLVFVRTIDDVNTICGKLTDKKNGVPADHVCQLTGTMRGYERDRLIEDAAFQRFLPPSKDTEGAVYLVCTSAGEVGVNLSADHMICDLSTFDSMAQRLGRVNRFGDRKDTRVDVVYPTKFDEKHALTPARTATLELLQQLNGDASPKALGDLPADRRLAAFAPEPTILPATDILFDAWAMTTIRDKMPGRPPVAPYLHGVAEWEPPRTSVAWRNEVEVLTDELLEREGDFFPQELLADYPLKPHELLNDTSERVFRALEMMAKRPDVDCPLWIVGDRGDIEVTSLQQLLMPEKKQVIGRIGDCTILLPPSVRGLTGQGTLNGRETKDTEHPHGYDIADCWLDDDDKPRRKRLFSRERKPTGGSGCMTLIRTIDLNPWADDEAEDVVDAESESDVEADTSPTRGRFWHWFTRPRDAENATRASARPIKLVDHTRDVIERTTELVEALKLPDDLQQAVILAAEFHDLGKRREIGQRTIGNPQPLQAYAKPGRPGTRIDESNRWRPRRHVPYRHEFGSLLDLMHDDKSAKRLSCLSTEMQDVVLHLVAAHHGRARPHFPQESFDHECYSTQQNELAALEAMRRFARLQRRYGRWGLAYLESLLRAADWAASAKPSDNGGAS